MLHIVFEYADALSNWEWRRQECTCSSVKQCKEIYGLGVDCLYRIISVEEVNGSTFNNLVMDESVHR